MSHTLPDLPYARDALAPVISAETIDYHYGKHHQAYVTNLNKLITGTEFEHSSLEEIICSASGGLFNNAAQVWNHSFYWQCLSPNGGGEAEAELASALTQKFGSFTAFVEQMTQSAATNFGSGWTWLVKTADGNLEIINTTNAGNPLTDGKTPLLAIDVWEHAYYIDYRNARPKYLQEIWKLVNWAAVAANYTA